MTHTKTLENKRERIAWRLRHKKNHSLIMTLKRMSKIIEQSNTFTLSQQSHPWLAFKKSDKTAPHSAEKVANAKFIALTINQILDGRRKNTITNRRKEHLTVTSFTP